MTETGHEIAPPVQEAISPSQRFIRLPVLDSILEFVNPKHGRTLDGFVLVAVQHLLETTGSLFEALFSLGLRPSEAFAMGKIYSTCRQVSQDLAATGVRVFRSWNPEGWGYYCARMQADVMAMWDSVLAHVRKNRPRGIIVLDDGGYAVASAPVDRLGDIPVCAVEQTSSGLKKMDSASAPRVRVVQVANSAAKTVIEPALISRAVLKRMRRLPIYSEKVYGVIGMGNIGTALAADLLRRGARTIAYDVDPVNVPKLQGTIPAMNAKHFFRSADIIFGCTGFDVLGNQPWWRSLEGEKIAASCSSHDQEFASVLRLYGETHAVDLPLRDVCVPLSCGGQITVLRGGFPINFDNKRESVPANDIQLTRGLLLS